MNTDYQDIKSYKKQISVNICENLCPNLTIYLRSNRGEPGKDGKYG